MTGYIKFTLTENGREETPDGLRVNQGCNMEVELRDVHREDKSFLMAKMAEALEIDNPLLAQFHLLNGFQMIREDEKNGELSETESEKSEKKED